MEDYTEDYHKRLHRNLLNNERYYLFRANYSHRVYLRHLSGKIIEFGCGIGQNIYTMRDHAIGVEISDFAVKECKKRGIRVVGKLDKLNGLYDGCLSVHVFEHLEEHGRYLNKIRALLNDHGRLLLVLPVFKRNKPEWKDFGKDASNHLYYWNFQAINGLLTKHGFNIVINKFNYAKGFSLVYRLPFNIAVFLIGLFGFITNTKEMVVVAEKAF